MTEIDKLLSNEEDDYLNNRIINHLLYIKRNVENNKIKDVYLFAQWIFAIGITTIPITVGILLFYIPNMNP